MIELLDRTTNVPTKKEYEFVIQMPRYAVAPV